MYFANELLIKIFSYLPYEDIYRGVRGVNYQWRENSLLKEDLDLSWLGKVKNPKEIIKSIRKERIKTVTLKDCYLQEEIISKILKKFDRCHTLNLISISCPWSSFFNIPKNKQIKNLILDNTYVLSNFHMIFITGSCKEIEVLSLENVKTLTDYALALVGNNCKNLEKINISYNKKITFLAVDRLIQSCPRLKTIEAKKTCFEISQDYKDAFKEINFIQ